MTKNQSCSRCGEYFNNPVEKNANYVVHTDFTEKEIREINYAMVHTEETMKRLNKMDRLLPERNRQSIAAEMASFHAPKTVDVSAGTKQVENTETVDMREMEFSVPVEEYEQVEVQNVTEAQQSEEVARAYKELEEREVQKTGLVCPDCTNEEDDIVWGPDA